MKTKPMGKLNFHRVVGFVSVFIIGIGCTDGMHDGQYDKQEINNFFDDDVNLEEDGVPRRIFRNADQDRYSPKDNPRFGWQNPIRVAPTNPPSTTKPTTRAPVGTGRQCPKGSRRDRQTERCTDLGSRSSCGENMAFYEDPTNKQYGQCDCVQETNTPLVFHRDTGKCYFIFQQAFCPRNEWLTIDESTQKPQCSLNRCLGWTMKDIPTWNWADNSPWLDRKGIVPLFADRTCVFLGSPCRQEGNQDILNLLMDISQQMPATGISLAFDGTNLACIRERRD